MSLHSIDTATEITSAPRVSGDEPEYMTAVEKAIRCSPRERG